MLGLILKDLYSQKKNLRTSLLILLIFVGVFGFLNQEVNFAASFIIFFSAMLSLSAFSFDNYCKWDNYALTLPISKKEIVGARYLLTLIFCGGAALIAILMTLIFAQFFPTTVLGEQLFVLYAMLAILLLVISCALPMVYRFGAERGRIMMLAVMFVPFILIQMVVGAGVTAPSAQLATVLGIISLPFALLCFFLSFTVSVKIYSRKEF